MNQHAQPLADLEAATAVTRRAQRDHDLPRWYAVCSTVIFVFGVAVETIGAMEGWFLPALGFVVLTANTLTFPFLVGMWRSRGVVPRDGRLTTSRYWRAAPVLVLAAAVLGFWGIAASSDTGSIWVWLGVVVPFAIEHALRLRAWVRR